MEVNIAKVFLLSALSVSGFTLIIDNKVLRVPDQNGIARLYNMLEIDHSGPDPRNGEGVCGCLVTVIYNLKVFRYL